MLKRSLRTTWLVPAATLALMGCPNEELAPLEPCTVAGISEEITQSGTDQVDLLFVIDNSGSMTEEQQKLEIELPNLVKILTTGEFDGTVDGEPDFQPVKSLHLGVVSTDMGTQGAFDSVPGPVCDGKGGDGILLRDVSAVKADAEECQGLTIEAYQVYEAPDNDADIETEAARVANQFSCVATLGTTGCGLEQQLEAMLKAVTPANSEEVSFVEGDGHGTNSNKGFVRDDAVLAVIQVTDEEDCSATKAGRKLFLPGPGDAYNGPDENFTGQPVGINFKCASAQDSPDDPEGLLQPTQRFVDGLRALKPLNPERVIFAAIAGIPQTAEGPDFQNGDVQDFDKILAMPEMQILPGPDENEDGAITVNALPKPSCVTDADGSASPARRFVEVAKGFGENGVVLSICSSSYQSALNKILEKISKQLSGACLPNPLNPDNKGVVRCDVVEILSAAGKQSDCSVNRGRTFKEIRTVEGLEGPEQRVVCNVNQVAVIDGKLTAAPTPLEGVNPLVGWYYDDFSEEVLETCAEGKQQRIATTDTAALASGAKASFECFSPVGGNIESTGKEAVGAACTDDSQCNDNDDYDLFCEEITRSCQIACAGDANCPDGWVCDDEDIAKPFCVNPKCPPTQ